MADIEEVHVALPPDLAADLRAAVRSGDYASVAEAVRDAVRGWRLRRKLQAFEATEVRRIAQAE